MTHLLRYAVDHGIEPPEVRTERNKPAEGSLTLRARAADGKLIVEVVDDGAGIDPAYVIARAVASGKVPPEQARRLREREALRLIFMPGFSMSTSVTHVSGRGVGMDAVRNRVESLGGTVDVDSRPGAGTTIRFTVPMEG